MSKRRYSHRPASMIAAAMLMSLARLAVADGPGSYSGVSTASQAPEKSKEERAIETYNEGYELVQRADRLAGQNSAASQKAYKNALKKFSAAAKLDPSMHEAFTYMGYANRKIGNHEAALAAYDRALKLSPDYTPAIEYQGEAFLGLNRINEARNNYLRLYALDQGEAHKLLRAMTTWADNHAAQPPANVDVAALQAWVAERETAHDPKDLKAGW